MTDKVTAPPAPDAPTPRARVGKFDHLIVEIGKRGAGKSVHACQRARELQAEAGGAYVIGHSMGGRMPAVLPDGFRPPLRYYRNVEELGRGLRRWPNDWHIIAPPHEVTDREPHKARSSADDLIRYSMSLSQVLRDAAWRKAHPWAWDVPKSGANYDDLECTPVIVIVDEGVAVTGAAGGDRAKGEKTDWFREWLISLRHYHTAPIFNIQSATMRSWHILEQATEINVFQTSHQYALNALDVAGATDDDLERIAKLAKYEHVTIYPVAR